MTYGDTDDFGFKAAENPRGDPRSARDDSQSARDRSRTADIPLRRARFPFDGCLRECRHGHSRLKKESSHGPVDVTHCPCLALRVGRRGLHGLRAGGHQLLAGTVRDASGGVLPGVTVEVASPALIEKYAVDGHRRGRPIPHHESGARHLYGHLHADRIQHRQARGHRGQLGGDGAGQRGDAGRRRRGNGHRRRGASPVVDVQNVAARTVMTREVMDAIPQGRNIQAIGIMIPGTRCSSAAAARCRATSADRARCSSRRSRTADRRIGANRRRHADEQPVRLRPVQRQLLERRHVLRRSSYSTGADSAEMGQGGLRINMIPKDGGNTFRGSLFGNCTGRVVERRQPHRRPAAARDSPTSARSRRSTTSTHRSADRSSATSSGSRRRSAGRASRRRCRQLLRCQSRSDSLHAGPRSARRRRRLLDERRRAADVASDHEAQDYRLLDHQKKSRGHWGISSTNPPEASAIQETPLSYTGNIKWTVPLSNKLMFEAGYGHYYQEYDELYQPSVTPTTYRIVDQTTGRACCAYTSQQYPLFDAANLFHQIGVGHRRAQPERRRDAQRGPAAHADRADRQHHDAIRGHDHSGAPIGIRPESGHAEPPDRSAGRHLRRHRAVGE